MSIFAANLKRIAPNMKERNHRLQVLRAILNDQEAGIQDDILRELRQQGHDVTQATLSRDLRTLKAIKVQGKNGYRYVLPDNPLYRRTGSEHAAGEYLRNSGFRSIAFSGNLAVIHTRPGYAGGLASDIDARRPAGVVGTLAGDDTILMVMAPELTPQQLVDELSTFIPAIKSIHL